MGGCGVNIGEVVRFKGFGPKMTVSEVWSKNIVRCQWFEGTELREGWYPVENLGVVAQDEDLPDRFGELPERTRPSIFDGQPPLTEEDKRGYSKEQWAEIIAENSGGLDGVEAGGAAGEDRRTVEAVSKGDDGVESGAVGVGEKKGVDG
jgi:uncharacterized protein YodC (DUF2158 family)